MMRCPMTQTSKFAYKAKPKQCLGLATIEIVLPHKRAENFTEIAFTKVCENCVWRLTKIKAAAIMQYKIQEYGPIMPPPAIRREIDIIPHTNGKPS